MKSLMAFPRTEGAQKENASERWAADLEMPAFLLRRLPWASHHAATQTQEVSHSWTTTAQTQNQYQRQGLTVPGWITVEKEESTGSLS